MAKHYERFLDADAIVSDTDVTVKETEVSDTIISSNKKEKVTAVKKLKGIKVEYGKDGRVISSRPI